MINKICMLVIALGLLAATASAIDVKVLTCTTTATNAATIVTDSISTIRGYIDSIIIDVVTAGTTGDIGIVASSSISTAPDVVLVRTNGCNTDAPFRTRFNATDISGGVLATGTEYFAVCGETITMTLTNASTTSIVFNAIIKFE